MLRIRSAEVSDIEALAQLLNQLFSIEQDFTPDLDKQRRGLEQLLQATGAYIAVAEQAGKIVGMATLQTVISTAEGGPSGLIEDLVVEESNRGRGVGKALMSHLEHWAGQKGLTRLQLLADSDNAPALAFYRNAEWLRTSLVCLRKNPI